MRKGNNQSRRSKCQEEKSQRVIAPSRVDYNQDAQKYFYKRWSCNSTKTFSDTSHPECSGNIDVCEFPTPSFDYVAQKEIIEAMQGGDADAESAKTGRRPR